MTSTKPVQPQGEQANFTQNFPKRESDMLHFICEAERGAFVFNTDDRYND